MASVYELIGMCFDFEDEIDVFRRLLLLTMI